MSKIMLTNVRLSFPSLFKKSSFDGKEGKYEATFLLPKKDIATYKAINEAIEAAISEAKVKIPADKRFIKDGDSIEYDGFADCWAIKAGNSTRPLVINRDRSPITEDDEIVYAGCYVNAQIGVWIQNNQYGKRVNANLYGVQFVKNGEPFGTKAVAEVEDFEEVEGDF